MNIEALETKLSVIHALGSLVIASIAYVYFRFNWDIPDTDTLLSATIPPGNWQPDGIHRAIAFVIAVSLYCYLRYRYNRLPLIEIR
jgi:hypothetical protein